MAENKNFQKAKDAIKKNKPAEARDLLTRLVRSDKGNPDYWLWLSSVVESRKEKIFCLQTVLRIDPDNQAAIRGLRALGARSPDEEIVPVAVVQRVWEVEIEDDETLKGFHKIWANSVSRIVIVAGASVIVLGFILNTIFGWGDSILSPKLTVTPLAWTSTSTPTITNTPNVRTPTSTPSVVQPLWMLLDATYTPRPAYVNTPHPRSEAYRISMNAYVKRDYNTMLTFMEQVVDQSPNSVDGHYYIGEAQRLLGNYEQALIAFEKAISLDGNFSPAYVGRAQIRLINKSANVDDDIMKALELDPNNAAAYFGLASYWLDQNEPEKTLETLDGQEYLLGEYPEYYFLRAQALFKLDQLKDALPLALEANRRDMTSLPTYLLIAEIYFELDRITDGFDYLKTYGLYQENDPMYWALLGRAYYERGIDYKTVAATLEKALDLDDQIAIVYQYRGLAALRDGNGKQAVNDLFLARNLDPQSFSISLSFGLAFWAQERYEEASAQMRASADLAKSDADLAKAYYHVAKLATEIGPVSRAKQYWNYLLDLPEGAVPDAWLVEANLYFNPSTATPTVTLTSTAANKSTLTPNTSPTPK
ncbi:MAG: tetratricopeptide repeat protein [Chloroflexota bacterium]